MGRRGAFLLTVGLAWVGYGAGFVLTPTPASQSEGLSILTGVVPLAAWGWVWMVCGVVGIVCSALRVGRDQAGFTACVVPAATWSAGYLMDWLVVGDYARGWVVATTYAALAAAIVIVSGWPEVRHG